MRTIVDPKMTPTWVRIYEYIRWHWIEYGHAPSQGEIMRNVDCSIASIQNGFRELTKAGHLEYQKYIGRSAKPTDLEAKLYREAPDPWETFGERQPWEVHDTGAST